MLTSLAPVKRLLEAAYTRGWLTSDAREKSVFLLEQGLHPEQVLIGTGLLTPSRYSACIEEAYGRALVRVDHEALVLEERLDDAALRVRDESGRVLLYRADAWMSREHARFGEQEGEYWTFLSDIQRFTRVKDPVDMCVAGWFEELESRGVTEIRFGVQRGHGVVLLGSEERLHREGLVQKEEVPAMQLWFEYGFGSLFWDARRRAGIESDWMEASARKAAHPLTKSVLWKTLFDRPRGVVVALEPDMWLTHRLEVLPEVTQEEQFFEEGLHRIAPQSAEQEEWAWHAALQGKSLFWVDARGTMLARARLLASAGVPVTVLRRRPQPAGSTWEMYTIHA
ncbi:hypothetical protein KBD13_02785 [Patescibacteria group bacterium]|nr:hypothetical protein [Patescibacteria group bacterium]